MLFAQVGCGQTDETLMAKRLWGLALACIGLFMVWFFRVSVLYMKNMDIINEKIFDSKLITVNDYTVKIKITESMFSNFKNDDQE